MKVLGIIPARGGSKGLPGKNIKMLAGKPLLAWTVEAAISSRLDRVILSSDCSKIIQTGNALHVDVPFVRPESLAQDNTPAIDVVFHAIQTLRETEGYIPDAVMLLQPTSPLRTTHDINQAIAMFEQDKSATSLVSVVKVPHNMVPESVMKLQSNGYLVAICPWDEKKNMRQAKPKYYARNGAAIYVVKTDCLLNKKSMYGDKILAYEMPKERSIDIDDVFDFELCEIILSNQGYFMRS